MDLTVVDPHALDSDTSSALADVENAAARVDSPWIQPVSGELLRLRHLHGWDGRGTDHLVLAHEGSSLVGYAAVELPYWDNTHLGWLDVQTHPEHRGLGIGEAMFEEAVRIVGSEGRRGLLGDAWIDSHRAKFWERLGFELASIAAQRRLVTADLDWPHLDSLLHDSEAASAEYEILEVPPHAADEMMPHLLELQAAMNDAPKDALDLEDDVWNDERLRGFENAFAARRITLHRLVARRRTDGEFGGHTVVAVEEERPWLGFQEDTGVRRSHRGHRLGMRLKIEMLRLLRERQPQIEQIDTWNAESNSYMIAVNDALGCVVVGRGGEYQRSLV